ncbi:ParB N-terminal domain-containing protein [Nitrosospira sp. Is2]|uniref:ParB N-terminal domain-containing protein n=1 Tax=Nitrosospira sp. Is2 TaxID=3080532 RepID=UPI002955D858|nr:ParB N-terminal domain-containing protein [Nitrosospira sp. Is2]WON75149.1 ParB N-terminal domain-containing protein [Nitrosospira sp. Is2]
MTSKIKSVLSHFYVAQIQVARENDLLYEPFGTANSDDAALVVSINELGVQEPLTLSNDGFLLSGHRRLAAAKYLRLETVPVRFKDINFAELSKPERLEELRSFNQQRDKTPGEKIREQLLQIDPEEAYAELCRKRVAQQSDAVTSNVDLGAIKKRKRITTVQFLEAAQKVILDNMEYWPLTVRRVHYLLLNNPPLRHDKKPNSRYENERNSYQALTNLLSRARLVGIVSLQAIEDTTRPIQLGGGFSSSESFVRQQSENFLKGYSRNLMQGQPHHIEIMLEKNALRSIIEKVARDYCIPVTTGRGFSSLSPRYDLYGRFKRSGKDKLILLMLTDFDPDGEQIAASFARSMRDDFGVMNVHAVKVALTAEDVELYNLPSDLDAKPSSPNYSKFIEKYGHKAVELDAAPVELLQKKLRDAIESLVDVAEFHAQIDLEKKESRIVEAYRRTAVQAIAGSLHG